MADELKIEEQNIKSNRLENIGLLSANIYHGINNMMSILRVHTEIAYKSDDLTKIRESIYNTLNTCDEIHKLLRNLLSYSNADNNEKTICSVKDLLESVISLVMYQLKAHNIVLVEKFDSDCCVDVDINEIQQAIINLIINAIESMPNKGGKLEITACKFSDFAEISFIDNGIGIRKENLDKIFEPFFTTKKNVRLSNNKVNIGLGLAISKTIVEKYGGKITVESEHKKGAKFTIKLPLKKMSFLESMVSSNKNIPRYKKY